MAESDLKLTIELGEEGKKLIADTLTKVAEVILLNTEIEAKAKAEVEFAKSEQEKEVRRYALLEEKYKIESDESSTLHAKLVNRVKQLDEQVENLKAINERLTEEKQALIDQSAPGASV